MKRLLFSFIPKHLQNLVFGKAKAPAIQSIVNRSILTIWTCLRSLNPGALAKPKSQVLKVFGYIICYSGLYGNAAASKTPCCCKPKVVNFGYNKFVPSPYSKKIVVVPFDSNEGIAIFEQSQYKTAFFQLAPHYAPQQTITTCGIASGVIILNTLYAKTGKRPPLSPSGSFYDKDECIVYGDFIWTEENYFTPKVSKFLDRDIITGRKKLNANYVPGLSLNQLAKSLKLHGLDVKTHHVKNTSQEAVNQFRDLVETITENPTCYLIANYSLTLYLREGGGHFSPIAAYDKITDNVLILDTWAASNTWIWVKLEDLFYSMNTKDGSTHRGYLIIKGFKKEK